MLLGLRLRLAFLAERANFLAGGGDVVLVGEDVTLLRARGFSLTVFCSSVPTRSTLPAGEAMPFETFLGGVDVPPTGALLVPMESFESEVSAEEESDKDLSEVDAARPLLPWFPCLRSPPSDLLPTPLEEGAGVLLRTWGC